MVENAQTTKPNWIKFKLCYCLTDTFSTHYQTSNFRLSNFKAFADDKMKIAKTMISILDMVEKIVGKEENAGYQHFLLFPQCFQKALSSRLLTMVNG